MSDKIRISVEDLRAQSAELAAIASEFETQYKLAVNTMKDMKACMSMAMAVNMIIKMTRLVTFFVSLHSTLQQGVTIANHAADNFENTDIALRKLYGDTLTEEIKSVSASVQKVETPIEAEAKSVPASVQKVETPFEAKVEQLKINKDFSPGSYNPNNFMYYVESWKGQPIRGSQCFAMAHMMQVEVAGSRGYSIGSNVNVNDIQVGDVIHYYGNGADATYGHWVFVTALDGDNITVAEGNWEPWTVTYGRVMNKNNISLEQIDRVS